VTPLRQLGAEPIRVASIVSPESRHDELVIGVRYSAHPGLAQGADDPGWRLQAVFYLTGREDAATALAAADPTAALDSETCPPGFGEFADGCGVVAIPAGPWARIEIWAAPRVATQFPGRLAVAVVTQRSP